MINPTSCDHKQVTATVTASNGATASPSTGYQATNCLKLHYSPKLALTLKGSTRRTGNPAVRAVLTQPPHQANTAGATVLLRIPGRPCPALRSHPIGNRERNGHRAVRLLPPRRDLTDCRRRGEAHARYFLQVVQNGDGRRGRGTDRDQRTSNTALHVYVLLWISSRRNHFFGVK